MTKIKTVDRYNDYGVLLVLEDGSVVDAYHRAFGLEPQAGQEIKITTDVTSRSTGSIVASLHWSQSPDETVTWEAG